MHQSKMYRTIDISRKLLLIVLQYLVFNQFVFAQFQINGSAEQTGPECFSLTQEVDFVNGSIWSLRAIKINKSFDIQFKMNLGCLDGPDGTADIGADGIAFVLQQIDTEVGSAGEGIGYGELSPSLAIEFDTYQNFNRQDPVFDHIAIVEQGDPTHSSANNLAGPVSIFADQGNAEDCTFHKARIRWDAPNQTLEVYIDCELRLSYTGDIINDVFNGRSKVLWGFTSATGGSVNHHQVCMDYIDVFEDGGSDGIHMCENDTVQLDIGPGLNYNWTPTSGLSDSTIRNPLAFPDSSTTYIVSYADSCGFTRSDTIEVTVRNENLRQLDVPVCENDTVRLVASLASGVNYLWRPTVSLSDSTIRDPLAFPSVTTDYTVTVETNGGCVLTDTVSIVVSPKPLDTAFDHIICSARDSVQLDLSASLADTYVWVNNRNTLSADSIPNPIAVPTSLPTSYFVSTFRGECWGRDTITINPSPAAAISVSDDVLICAGDTTTLKVTGDLQLQYQWSPDSSLNDPTIPNPIAQPQLGTTYIVTATDNSGCVHQDSVTISIFENSIPGDANLSVCKEGDVRLNGPIISLPFGTPTYSWSPVQGLSDPTIRDPLASPDSFTSYLLTISLPAGCSRVDTFRVSIHPDPVADAGEDQLICNTESVQLIASGGESYSWSPADSLSDPGIFNPIANPSISTQYVVTVTDSNACQASDTVFIAVSPAPLLTIQPVNPICSGDSIQLIASSNDVVTFRWQGNNLSNATIANPLAFPQDTSFYTVTITDGGGCQSTDSVFVAVSRPFVEAGRDTAICLGQSTRLVAQTNGNLQWSPALGLSDPGIASPIASPVSSTTYTLRATDALGCINEDSVRISIHNLPDIQAIEDQEVCLGDSILLSVSGGLSYVWVPALGLSDPQSPRPVANPLQSSTYIVSGQDANGCQNTDSVFVEVLPLPIAEGPEDMRACFGDTVVLEASGAAQYQWIIGENTSRISVSPDESQIFWVIPFSEHGCQGDTLFAEVGIVPLPEAKFELEYMGDLEECPLPVQFINQSAFASEYRWEFGDGNTSTEESPLHLFRGEGEYSVRLIANNDLGCSSEAQFDFVRVTGANIFFPNAFTPNGDGHNDRFYLVHDNLQAFSIQIYDRWGRLIVESAGNDFRWDGTKAGVEMPEGVYVFKAEVLNCEGKKVIRSGTVTLIR